MIVVTPRIDGSDVVSTIVAVIEFSKFVSDKLFFEIFKERMVVWIGGDDDKIGDNDGSLEGDDVVGESVTIQIYTRLICRNLSELSDLLEITCQ